MTNIPGSQWPLLETYVGNHKLINHLSKVPSERLAPAPENVFEALRLTPPEEVKVVIIGQDPYIRGEAHGLSFSSPMKITPSLKVVFSELEWEYGTRRQDPDLTSWAKQGVLLLNTILTTELGTTLAHEGFGWQDVTKEILRYVINLGSPISVMLWGNHAKEFWTETIKLVDVSMDKIQVLAAVHPQAQNYNPNNKFTGCGHFQQANTWLEQHDRTPINWFK